MEEKIVKPQISSTVSQAPIEEPKPTIGEVSKSVEPVPENKKAGDMTIPSDPYYTDPLFYEVVSYFGIPQQEWANAKNELSVIVDYAILDGKSNKMEDVLVKIREMEDKLQPPSWGEKRYSNVYKYIRLASKKASFEKAMSAFTKKGAQV